MSFAQPDEKEYRFRMLLQQHVSEITEKLRPDIKVTIVVRAPEGLPAEAIAVSNDHLILVARSLEALEAEGPMFIAGSPS